MFVIANLIRALAEVVSVILTVYYWLILVRALLSWVNPDPFNPIVQFLQKSTEPVLYPIRKFLPFTYSLGIDFSPLVAFLVILFLRNFLVKTLIDVALRVSGT